MNPSAEATIQKSVIDYLVGVKFLVIRVNSGAVTQAYKGKERHVTFVRWQTPGRKQTSRGIADILALAPWGQLFAIECKAFGKIGNTSNEQATFLEAAEQRGAIAIIADNLDDVIAAVEYHRSPNAEN